MHPPFRLVFLGSDPIALPLLHWLAGGESITGRSPPIEMAAVFTQPDRAVGRGQKVQPNAIKTWALALGLPVLQPQRIGADTRGQLAALNADLALVMAYGHILPDDFIAVPRLGMLNFHTSLLPKFRGASPVQTAIALGERETGVTLMRIVRKLDAGPIADAERIAIGPLDTASDVEAKLAAACVPLFARALPLLAAGALAFVAQEEAAATYCRKLGKDDGALDFSGRATQLAARINGLFPWPSCTIDLNGQPVRLGLAEALAGGNSAHQPGESKVTPGEILGSDGMGLLVATGEGTLRVRRLQRPGGKLLPAADFLRGFTVAAGTKIPSRPMGELAVARTTG